MKVDLVSITKPIIDGLNSAEELIAYCARVSNPGNQMNSATASRLIKYLVKNKHWSPFEMASMCVSIETTRAIAAQILRHRSFSFQEFSQRYADVSKLGNILEPIELRMAGTANRQSSEQEIGHKALYSQVDEVLKNNILLYKELIDYGVATETARMVLPLCTKTKLYMNGTIRSWIHYIALRTDEHTQKEHRLIAEEILKIFNKEFPAISEILNNRV